MKRSSFLLIIFSLALFSGCFSTVPHGYKPLTDLKEEQLYVKKDDFQNVSFIRHKHFFINIVEFPMEIYEVKGNYIRAEFQYTGKSWLFMKGATLVNDSGERMLFNFDNYDVNRKVLSDASVRETVDVKLTDAEVDQLKNLISAEGDKRLRLNGKHNKKDWTLMKQFSDAVLDILNHYNSEQT